MNRKEAWVLTHTDEKTDTFAGGAPYLRPGEEWPASSDGNRWAFLMQVDLSTVPDIGLNLPRSGYLQFFHKPDDLYGLNFHSITTPNCLVRHVTDAVDTQVEVHSPENTPLKSVQERAYFTGSLVSMPPRPGSYDYEGTDYEEDDAGVFDYDFYLGGNPMFTQDDFRTGNSVVTLLLGSDSGNTLMWGDMGSAGFWVPDSALATQDYSSTFLYWDCF